MSESRLVRLLPFACLAAAICLFASELMTTFEFTPPGGEALAEQGGADRHGNALALLAVFSVGALAIAVFAGSKPAAIAVAASGGVALLVFLLADLPDANAVGTLDDARNSFFDAEAVPQGGFFLEMIGSVALTITGIALATMTPEQLLALGPKKREPVSGPRRGSREDRAETRAVAAKDAHEGEEAEGKRRLRRRPRTRQRG